MIKDVLDSVECLDVELGDWLEDVEPLPTKALGVTCVAISLEDFM